MGIAVAELLHGDAMVFKVKEGRAETRNKVLATMFVWNRNTAYAALLSPLKMEMRSRGVYLPVHMI